ncbi:MAG: carbamoyl-phosphate synthase large subunit [Prevotella sp.]|nr:carbamoyl-phosphate synthase large subunit [Prevotella sp.]
MKIQARLILSDGTVFSGWSFGYAGNTVGEVVFNTAMTGYPESLTDPSYAGQILVMTYPLIGNYGVPSHDRGADGLPLFMESDRIHVSALVVADYSETFSHWNARESLAAWLQREQIPAITGIDTRRLTQVLREHGVMMGRIETGGSSHQCAQQAPPAAYAAVNWVQQVSCREVTTYTPPPAPGRPPRVVLVDCGVKANIIRCLLRRGIEVVRVPWDYDFNQLAFDGLFLANGPGDPERCDVTVRHVRQFLQGDAIRPCMGICLGNQLLARAAGAKTYKLKYGHRSHNQPVRLVGTTRCFITAQNHGYAVDDTTLPEGWEPMFVNMNDGSNEGIRHTSRPWMSAQFHPEACSGPVDTEFLFDEFAAMLRADGSLAAARPTAAPEPAPGSEATDTAAPSQESAPRRPRKVLLLGSGALQIGQAGEFDYSGAQALKALKEEGIETVLVNPNIATVQTSEGVADKVYFQPVRADFVARIIGKERPDGILLSFGGQTALNCGVELWRRGVLARYGVQVLGTPIQAIVDTEDRDRFVRRLDEIGVKTIGSVACSTVGEVRRAACALGFPVILRAAYALGGLGSGFCDDDSQLAAQAEEAFSFSPQVLVEKSLRGWKEIEYEVVRDRFDNCITVCNMENLDPLGIHTGESIVVAPSQTLTNSEYHKLRALAIRIVRHLGIVGECNVQYALDPHSDDYRVIEVNARLSRSSALASKATGYPLAFVAAKLSVGYGLFCLHNTVTKTTSAFFEPALDYVVCKLPRWDLTKFRGVSRALGSSMKSVGEVMAVGRTFEEALQKGLRMIGQGMHGFVENRGLQIADVATALHEPTDLRIFVVAQALQAGYTVDQVHRLTMIDRWFLQKLHHIVWLDARLADFRQYSELSAFMDNSELMEYLEAPAFVALLTAAKVCGFSDFQIGRALGLEERMPMQQAGLLVRRWRKELGVVPTVSQIDTLAAEYPAQTNYLYLSYL